MELELPNCVGCSLEIKDRYILRVAPDLKWHAACLKCEECHQYLDENCTCFIRDGKTYCKQDYVQLFGTKCDKCGCTVNKNDLVIRARTKIFHFNCFRCTPCEKQLIPGDEFALEDGGLIYCKDNHDNVEVKRKEQKSDLECNNNTQPQSPDGLQMCNIMTKHLSSEFGSNSGRLIDIIVWKSYSSYYLSIIEQILTVNPILTKADVKSLHIRLTASQLV